MMVIIRVRWVKKPTNITYWHQLVYVAVLHSLFEATAQNNGIHTLRWSDGPLPNSIWVTNSGWYVRKVGICQICHAQTVFGYNVL
jgi:hypothetical protein